jgi:DNA-directed RNA polymerase specialized sigma24 family protein
VKKQNDVSGPYATVILTDEHVDTKDEPFHEIVPDGFSIPSLNVLERKEVLPLFAQRIAQLPLASKKFLAMYYYENLPISGIAACFNLPACRIHEILRQTVGLLGNDLLKVISRKCHLGNDNNIDADGEAQQPTADGDLKRLS